MKQTFLILLFAGFANLLNAQEGINNSTPFVSEKLNGIDLTVRNLVGVSDYSGKFSYQLKTDYLKKSRTQKTLAWILTGVGVGIVTIGLLTQDYVDAFTGLAGEKNKTSPATYAVGGACIAGGIVLFAASSRNKRRAADAALIFRIENATVMLPCRQVVKSYYPAAGIQITLH